MRKRMLNGKRVNKKFSAEFKISLVMDMHKNHLGQRKTLWKHWYAVNRQEEAIYTFQRWCNVSLIEIVFCYSRSKAGEHAKVFLYIFEKLYMSLYPTDTAIVEMVSFVLFSNSLAIFRRKLIRYCWMDTCSYW